MHPVLLLAALIVGLVLFSWYKRTPTATQRRIRHRVLLIGGGLILLFALITGRLHPLFAALAAAVPLLYRVFGLVQTYNAIKGFAKSTMAGASPGPTPGRTSEIETAFLHMRLDHDSGAIDGTVRQGSHQGRALSTLELGELLRLLAECRTDKQSITVLEAYLDRTHEGWRAHRSPGSGPSVSRSGMSEREARAVLGVGADATRAEIIEAHRRLIQRFHPDRGGSDYLAAKLNEAKDLLIDGCD